MNILNQLPHSSLSLPASLNERESDVGGWYISLYIYIYIQHYGDGLLYPAVHVSRKASVVVKKPSCIEKKK